MKQVQEKEEIAENHQNKSITTSKGERKTKVTGQALKNKINSGNLPTS